MVPVHHRLDEIKERWELTMTQPEAQMLDTCEQVVKVVQLRSPSAPWKRRQSG